MTTLQEVILARFRAQQIREREVRLCGTCAYANSVQCSCRLLPITSDGGDCPYYKKWTEK